MAKTDDLEKPVENQVSTGQLDKVDLSYEYIYSQAMAITEAGEKQGIPLRLIGATAFINHCPKYSYLYKKAQRKLTDVDLMAYSKTPIDKLDALFKDLGYEPIQALGWHTTTRDIYVNQEKLFVDIFRDVLSYCHPISFIGRLELDFPTITVADLLLEKLQIVQINAKDLFDVVILLLEHDLKDGQDKDNLDINRVTGLWANDWGFYYTGTTNLKKVLTFVEEMKVLDSSQKQSVKDKVNYLLQRVEEQPKTLRWKLRSLIGTKIRWYEVVESVER
ncbi:MAG: hypothetical protein MUO64_22170 [Anaerolineales bacterium]|nr:hypothetical protein [Anaerolineales bacterium]